MINEKMPASDFNCYTLPLGWDWYRVAHERLLEVSEYSGWKMPDLAALMGVLSPRVTVDRNWQYLEHFLDTHELHPWVMSSVRASAERLFPHLGKGHSLETLESLAGSRRAVKVWPFASNILSAGEDDRVTVDTWVHKFFGLPEKLRVTTRRAVQQGIQEEGYRRGFFPAQLQAALWTVQRGRV
tara:strand:+ start:205 stop:756 length:552 start_codon:yes stop_codon:yes gene_type:complete